MCSGGVGTDIGYVNIVGPGKGEGVGGQTLGIVNIGEGFGDRYGDVHIVGVGEFWDKHWGC